MPARVSFAVPKAGAAIPAPGSLFCPRIRHAVAAIATAAWLAATAATLAADEPPSTPDCPAELKGCWVTTDQPAGYLLFEDGKCTLVDAGGPPQALQAAYALPQVILTMMGQSHSFGATVEGEVLTFTSSTKTRHYRRSDTVPAALRPAPLAFGPADPIPADRVQAIQADLMARLQQDQQFRQPGQVDAERMRAVDSENTAHLKKLVAEVGWIDADRFGKHASLAAFLIVQHSGDVPLMQAVLPHVEKDVKAKLMNGQLYALLYDRVQLMTGGKQRYGTQITPNAAGEMVVAGLEDKAQVDEFRREIGMGPLAPYLEMVGKAQGGATIQIED
jgi:hypothetical protein